MKNSDAIILFGKYPREGFVKTRLAQSIGDAKATEFYRRCLLGIFSEVEKLTESFDVFFYFADADDETEAIRLTPSSFSIVAQQNVSLPSRINLAFEKVFELGYEKVSIFSTDVPELNVKTIQNAYDQLTGSDCAIGSDSDGGYYCLGMKSYKPKLLSVTYGSPVGMFKQTVENAKKCNIAYAILPELSDVDTYGDLQSFKLRSPILWDSIYGDLLN